MIQIGNPDGLALLPGPLVLAAGVFDGVHLGHQAVLRAARDSAMSVTEVVSVVCVETEVIGTFGLATATRLRDSFSEALACSRETL